MKYAIIFLSSFIIELSSTFYIKNVSEGNYMMIFFAFISPFLGLPFLGYIVETKNWKSRITLAFFTAFGYSSASLVVYLLK
jgi:hypothetical protein